MRDRTLIEQQFHRQYFWVRFAMMFLGLWLLSSPETFGYMSTPARFSDWISGILLIGLGLISMSFSLRRWIWMGCLVGIWLQFAPLYFWAAEPAIYLNDTLIGLLAIALCIFVPMRPPAFDIGPQIPPGWSYNPSSWQQRVPIVLFGTLGWFVARYLCAFQLHYIDEVWPPGSGTEQVITSTIAQQFPFPDAGLGALAYSLEALMGAKGGVRRWHTMPWLVVTFALLVVPLGFVSIVLVILQPVVVGAWCLLCLLMACCMLVMIALTVDEMICVCQYIHSEQKRGRGFWHILFHGSSYTHDEVDTRTPAMPGPASSFFQSMVWGVTLPWNLVLTALLGIALLFGNSWLGFGENLEKQFDVMGALITVFSIIAWAEVARALRFINLGFAVWMVVAVWLAPGLVPLSLLSISLLGIVLILLSIPKGGTIRERYGSWQTKIF